MRQKEHISLTTILLLLIVLTYAFTLQQRLRYERNKYSVLFTWMKKHPGQDPFITTKDEKEFIEYISDVAKTM